MADGGERREIHHPGQEQIIEIGIDAGQGGGADGVARQGEINIRGWAVTAKGSGAVEDGGLHLGIGGENLLDSLLGRIRQARGLGCRQQRTTRHGKGSLRAAKRSRRAPNSGAKRLITA